MIRRLSRRGHVVSTDGVGPPIPRMIASVALALALHWAWTTTLEWWVAR